MGRPGPLTLRPAIRADAERLAEIHIVARATAMPWLRIVHSDEETRWWMVQVVLRRLEVCVAEHDREVAGFLALQDGFVEQLYVAPDYWRDGVGSALLEQAKLRLAGGFRLWTFQRNAMARTFYRKHGLIDIRETDGSANEEREPDVLMEWRADRSP